MIHKTRTRNATITIQPTECAKVCQRDRGADSDGPAVGAVCAGWVFKCMEITQIVPYASSYSLPDAGACTSAIRLNTLLDTPRLVLLATVMLITAWVCGNRRRWWVEKKQTPPLGRRGDPGRDDNLQGSEFGIERRHSWDGLTTGSRRIFWSPRSITSSTGRASRRFGP